MTNEEAIEVLRTIEVCSFKDKTKKYFFKDVTDALDMAIEALDFQDKLEKRRKEVERAIKAQLDLWTWLSTFNSDSATECFVAVQELKKKLEKGEMKNEN